MPTIKARVILAILSFFLFVVAQMNRVNINIAIVAMDNPYIGDNWDAKVIVLGAYYWCYSLIELPGTLFLKKHGCRKILALNVFLSGILNFVFPSTYEYHPLCGIIIRAVQGLLLGITWPAIAVMSAKWIPRQERSKFSSTYQGSSVGTSVTYALGGLIIYNLGWQYIFYLSGVLSVVWVAFWLYFAYDSPAQHPRISEAEREYIEKAIGEVSTKKSVPWGDIFTSKPFWGVFVGTFGIMWFVIATAMQLPAYLSDVHQVNIRMNGLLLCIPDIFSFLFSFSFSIFIDKQITNETMSITNARKLAMMFSHIVPASLLVFLSVYGSNSISVAMVLIVTAVAAGGATSSGNLANIVDISPSNAGYVMAISKSLCFVPGVLSPMIVKHFTAQNPTNWMPVFSITTVILISTSIFYFAFGSGEIQPWDKKNDKEIEMKELDSKQLMIQRETSKFDLEIGLPWTGKDENNMENKTLIKEKPIPKIDAKIGIHC